VAAAIDKGNKVIEANEGNNRLIKNLGPASAGVKPKLMSVQTGQTDLMVSSIRLDDRQRVIVEVKNIGMAGLDPSLWTAGSQNVPQLHLKMNGNGWAMISLKGLDPRKRLSLAGGVALYNTKYVLRQSVLIDATIDVKNVVSESNENNNTLSKTIAP
jgi:subtilase family serine protease